VVVVVVVGYVFLLFVELVLLLLLLVLLLLLLVVLVLLLFVLGTKSDGVKFGVVITSPKVLKWEIAVLTKSVSVNGFEDIWISSSYKSGMEKSFCAYELKL